MMNPSHLLKTPLLLLLAPARDRAEALCRAWRRDPLSHPALRKMTLTELADLPFDRTQCPDGADGS